MANTFLAALGNPIGKSLCEHDRLAQARDILERAKAGRREIVLPVDVVTAEKLERSAPSRTVSVEGVAPADMILDIGRRSIEHVCSVLARAKTLVWNGPLGAFETEPFDIGTIEVAEAAAELSSAGDLVSVAGGGDTVSALHAAGAAERFTYVSTAGGAFLEWLEGRRLPGVEILKMQ
jgi:phosphoglycerate kinase